MGRRISRQEGPQEFWERKGENVERIRKKGKDGEKD